MIDLLKETRDLDCLTELCLNSMPEGYLYQGEEFKKFLRGFLTGYKELYEKIEKDTNSLFVIDENNTLLSKYLVEYGLPNVLFSDITTTEQAVFAINTMKLASTLVSEQDFINFLALFGINATFYNLNSTELLNHVSFDLAFPISFSNSISAKDKLTYWIYVEEPDDDPNVEYNGIGDAFDIDFISATSKLQQTKTIMDFIKPDYLKFQYITLYTKQLYGL
jgi:hypothetical protein